MVDPTVEKLQSWIESHNDEMIEDLRSLLRFASIEGEPSEGAPFGKENREALDWMLGKASAAGMETKDIEGYVGYGEFGSGDKMVMTLGHLDVVPVGPGWKHEPFGAEIDGGYIYSRGACDDKGPTVAMFYAARALKEVVGDPGVRVRSVFGCNEESGFKCVHRYMETEEPPTMGVAPDAGWPCIHGEKGICNLIVSRPLPTGDLTLLEISGGQRPNIVIDSCFAEVKVSAEYRAAMEEKVAESWDKNLSFSWDGDVLKIQAHGKAAHGAYPFGGDSAAIRLLRFLREAAPTAQGRAFNELHAVTHLGGDGLGISGADAETGSLTANLGIIGVKNGRLEMLVNIRYPATWKGADVLARAQEKVAGYEGGWTVTIEGDSPSLYFPLDHPLVKTIQEVYEAETGDTKKPGTMGGGTYARAVPNCVAIGTSWDGDGDAHETDERIALASVLKTARIYAHLLYRLCEVAKK